MSEEIERVIDEVFDIELPFGDTGALYTFAEFHEQPVLTFRNGSYISVNRRTYSADAIRSAIARVEYWRQVRSLDGWADVKDIDEVFARETSFNTQELDEFLDEM